MGKYTVIPESTFSALQLDAGVLLSDFNPASPSASIDDDIICATTGGIKIDCVPTYSDFGEDIDNCPNNMMELKHLDSWECKIGFTALNITEDVIALALGAADVTTTNQYAASTDTSVVANKDYYTRTGSSPNYVYTKVVSPTGNPSTSSYYELVAIAGQTTPRAKLEDTDFKDDIWWVGDMADGGFVAVKLINALSTSGLSLQTGKNAKGQLACELTGHVSIEDQSTMPMEFYVIEAA